MLTLSDLNKNELKCLDKLKSNHPTIRRLKRENEHNRPDKTIKGISSQEW